MKKGWKKRNEKQKNMRIKKGNREEKERRKEEKENVKSRMRREIDVTIVRKRWETEKKNRKKIRNVIKRQGGEDKET